MSDSRSDGFTIDDLRGMNPDRLFRVGDATVQRLVALAGGGFNGAHPDRLLRVGDAEFQQLLDTAEKGAPMDAKVDEKPAEPGEPAGSDGIELVNTDQAPTPPGPFSLAAVADNWVYSSGMGGLDPETGQVVSDDVIEQTIQAIKNTEAILAAAGCTLQDVVKSTMYLTDMADYPRVNAEYERAFAPHKPARTCVAVSSLPVRERMKLDTVAYKRR
ncbi:MAG: Rid family detoxifying hydrolase [Rhodospirillales bacterium]|jgi:2-iminobutanoate/2-iminopropanoate deaminase|nr:Rid family detoxifying hydrolase [Rhodospirillales bacterium]MDP6775035.1 Rid family detoxifying hydrolase [Rhodospirillales bacterium]